MESVEPCFRICNPSIPLQKLGRRENTDLKFQLKVFHEHREEDFDEFVQRFDNTRPDLEDSAECFDVLRHSVSETPSEPFLLSILQHLLFIRDDPNTKSVKTRYIYIFLYQGSSITLLFVRLKVVLLQAHRRMCCSNCPPQKWL